MRVKLAFCLLILSAGFFCSAHGQMAELSPSSAVCEPFKFKEPLVLTLAAYPEAVISADDGGLTLYPSPPPGLYRSTPEALTIKVEPVVLPPDNTQWWSYLAPIAGPAIAGSLALAGAWLGLRMSQQNTIKTINVAQDTAEKTLWQKANEAELKDVQKQLEQFYIPLIQLLRTDHHFAQDLRSRQIDKNYRLLTKLFEKGWLESLPLGDKKLVEIISNYAHQIEKHIDEKAGAVNIQVLPYLSRAKAHFQVLHLAFRGELGDDSKRFDEYVYPKQLDKVLELEVLRLSQRVEQLRMNPGVPPGPHEPLRISEDLRLSPWRDPDYRLTSFDGT